MNGLNNVYLVNPGETTGFSRAYVNADPQPMSRDIHLLRNGISFDLKPEILLEDSSGQRYSFLSVATSVTLTLTTNLKTGVESIVGIVVDSANASIKALTLPPPTPPSTTPNQNYINFQCFELTITAKLSSFEQSTTVRVFIHNVLTAWKLTPSQITLRSISATTEYAPKFSVLAIFDSEQILWDITEANGITFVANDVTLDSGTGKVVVLSPSNDNTFQAAPGIPYPAVEKKYDDAVTATLPAHLQTSGVPSTKSASVCFQGWQDLKMGHRSGPGVSTIDSADSHNVILVSEGFTDPDEFLTYANKCVEDISKETHLVPFNYITPATNFFSLFIPSPQAGSSIGSPYFYDSPTANIQTYKFDDFVTHIDADAHKDIIADLFWCLGYPSARVSSYLLNSSSGASNINSYKSFITSTYDTYPPSIAGSGFAAAAAKWARMKNIAQFNENDSTFGLMTGPGFRAKLFHSDSYRFQRIHYRRGGLAVLHHVLKNLQYDKSGTWTAFGAHFDKGGKDQDNVVLICKNSAYGAENLSIRNNSNALIGRIISVNVASTNVPTVAGDKSGSGVSIVLPSLPLPTGFHNSGYGYMHVIAHELSHSYQMRDEYSTGIPLSGISSSAQNQIRTSVNTVFYNDLHTSNHLDPAKLKWNTEIFNFVCKVKCVDSTTRTFSIDAADLTNLAVTDSVQVTTVPFKNLLTDKTQASFSGIVSISNIDKSTAIQKITISSATGGLSTFVNDTEYTLMRYAKGYSGSILRFVAPKIMAHMVSRNGSLTMKTSAALANFTDIITDKPAIAPATPEAFDESGDRTALQLPQVNNLPAEFFAEMQIEPLPAAKFKLSDKMTNTFDIGGLYVGGLGYTRGVYHPFGRCMMRSELDASSAALPLCPICAIQLLLNFSPKKLLNYFDDVLVPGYYIKQLNNLV